MYNVLLTIFVQINPAVMSATHCFILFTVISIVSSNRGDRKYKCGIDLSPSISLAERVRTCNDGLSDCRNVPEEARHIVADFMEDIENDYEVGFFNVHQGNVHQSKSFNQLIKDRYTKREALFVLATCSITDSLYNKQQTRLPKLGRVPGQNSITSGALESFYESNEFYRIKKLIKDTLQHKCKLSNYRRIFSNVTFT